MKKLGMVALLAMAMVACKNSIPFLLMLPNFLKNTTQ